MVNILYDEDQIRFTRKIRKRKSSFTVMNNKAWPTTKFNQMASRFFQEAVLFMAANCMGHQSLPNPLLCAVNQKALCPVTPRSSLMPNLFFPLRKSSSLWHDVTLQIPFHNLTAGSFGQVTLESKPTVKDAIWIPLSFQLLRNDRHSCLILLPVASLGLFMTILDSEERKLYIKPSLSFPHSR